MKLYCQEDEAFYTSQLTEEKMKCRFGGEVVPMKEEAYFFKMSKYADQLIEYIDEHHSLHSAESRKNEMLAQLLKTRITRSLCITYIAPGGIPVGLVKHVVYVWIDALSSILRISSIR